MIGTTLTHYRITGKLGEGGMGEVYRATDTKLGREVAIKVLPASINRDPARLARFEREAKALAALDHPHIAGIHGFEADQGVHFLVLELVEGETLRERLRRGRLPIKEALTVAGQIAEAIQEAHGKGVIHRDLKPENVIITRNGRVKVLDFGLAKVEQTFRGRSASATAPEVDSAAPTIGADTTHPGLILGTPAYMSPEQARAQEVDKRTDIWAFGCCLFECLAGQKPFRGQTTSDLVAEVLKGDPDWSQIPENTPREVVTLMRRCLEKEPPRRLSSMGDIALALDESTRSASEAHLPQDRLNRPAPSVGISNKVLWLVGVGLVILAIGGGTLMMMRPGSKGQPPITGGKTKDAPASVAASVTDQKSVAVLPFVNMSAEKADEYLSDGMTEELLNALAKIKGLRVPGRSSSFAFKGKSEDGIVRKVGEQLHVATVLEGSVRKAGNQLRITAQLIKVADGFQLWADTYDRDMSNIFAIQSDIAGRVAEALKVQLLGTAEPQKQPTDNIEAYKLYLQGRQLWNRRTGESVQQALNYFTEAISKDPNYALAYAGLADCYVSLPMYAGISLRESAPKLRAASMKALELDNSLAEPHAALADLKANFDWDWAAAESEFRLAIALNPSYSPARYWLVASVLRPQRRFAEALAEIQRAQELDPLSLIINLNLGESLSLIGQSEQGIQVLQKQIAFDPSFLQARASLAAAYYSAGKLPEALAELETMHRLDDGGTHRLDYLGFIYARTSRTNEARHILGRLQELQRQGFDNRVGIAMVQHGLGDDESALATLEEAAENRSFGLKFLNHEPFWRDLARHPRVQAILKTMKLVK